MQQSVFVLEYDNGESYSDNFHEVTSVHTTLELAKAEAALIDQKNFAYHTLDPEYDPGLPDLDNWESYTPDDGFPHRGSHKYIFYSRLAYNNYNSGAEWTIYQWTLDAHYRDD